MKMQIKTKSSTQVPDTAYNIRSIFASKDKDKTIDKVATEFESLLMKEFFKDSFKVHGMENYSYFYHNLILDILSRTSSFGIKEYMKKAMELQFEAMKHGYIKKPSIGKF